MANRHDIYIWEATQADLSKDFNDLLESGGDYAEIEQSPSANLLAFADALQQHQQTVDYSRSFFREVAYAIKHTTTKALIIELPEEDEWQRLLRDIVQLAQNYNLIVADEEIAMAFLPTGKIRPYGAEDKWHALLVELAEEDDLRLAYKKTKLPTTEYEYTLWVRPILSKRLEKYGFKLVKTRDNRTNDLYDSWYCREVECGQQYIEFRHAGEAPYFSSVGASFYMICPAISDIYYRFDFHQKESKVFLSSLGAYKNLTIENPTPLSEEQEQHNLDDVVSYIIQPIFEKTTNIIGLDDFVNSWLSKQPLNYIDTIKNPPRPSPEQRFFTPNTFKSMGVYCPQQLILARLANNPHYEKLRVFFEADKIFNIAPYNKELVTEWPKLVEYLCEDINPDTFWQQYALLKEAEKRLEEDRVQQFITQFKLNPDEELIPVSDQWYDSQTNLIWQRCCMGEHWQDAQLTGKAELMSWDEKEAYLERFKDTGWRLPTKQELEGLAISKKVGYITKVGFNFYDQIEKKFAEHWIEPHKSVLPHHKEICVVSVSPLGGRGKYRDDIHLVGYLRLVRSVH